jgi:hypothetical protein
MAFTMKELENLPTTIGEFLSSESAPVVLGSAAQGIMAGHPDEWQYGLGGVAADLGRSRIAASAAKRQAEERKQLADLMTRLLGGSVQYTEQGTPGPTTSTFKSGAGGEDTFTLKGDDLLGNRLYQSRRNLEGAPTAPASIPKPVGNVRPTAPPMTQSGMLPFFLAQAMTGGGGGGGDLFGLTPEQIQGISRTDILGQEGAGRVGRDIFSNLYSQALTDYYRDLPRAQTLRTLASMAGKKTEPKVSKMFKGADGNMWLVDDTGRTFSTGVPFEPGMEGAKVMDLGDRIALTSPSGTRTFSKGLTPQQQREADIQDRLMSSGVAPEDANVGAIIAAGGDPDIVTGGRAWINKHRGEVANIRNNLLTENKDNEGFSADARLANSAAPPDARSFVWWRGDKLDAEWGEVPLPVVRGRQMTMADARAEAQRQGVTLEVFLENVYDHLVARGEL